MPNKTAQRKRQPHQLPPGRHGLSRDYVVENQRERILSGVAQATAEVGYAAMTVEDVIRSAGVSRRTFYEHFKGKEDGFLAAYEVVSGVLLHEVTAAYDRTETFVRRVEECTRAFLSTLAEQPAYAEMCIVEVLVAGPAALARRKAVMQQFADLLERGAAEELPKARRPPALTSETLIGGVHEVVYSRVLRGETKELPALLPDLVFSLLLPYVGRDVATTEYKRLRRRKRS